MIADRVQRLTNARRAISPLHQLLVALQFYATGTFQNTVGNVLHISQTSVSRCVRDVSIALSEIARDQIVFPENLIEVFNNKFYI